MSSWLDATTLHILLVMFVASLVRSTFGFGEALIAVPLLALTLPVSVAAPVAVLLSTTIAAVVVLQDWHKIHLRSAAWLLAPTFLGIPFGVLLLAGTHQRFVKALLALILIAFSGYFLLGRKPPQLHNDKRRLMLVCGFAAGVLGGAYGMNGPPLVLYGASRRWSPQHFRATLQGYFLPAGIVTLAGYWMRGLWTPAVTHAYIASVPAAIPAFILGRALNHRIRGESFLRYVYAGLMCIGATLLYQSLK